MKGVVMDNKNSKTEKLNLFDKLNKYSKTNIVPMHMPGHKRNTKLLGKKLPYNIDITEITDFDDLHHAEGIIKNIENKATKTFNSKRSFLLVNGSTCGLLAGIRACTKAHDKILVARNSHKSVYNAIEMNYLDPIYMEPSIDSNDIYQEIKPETVKAILEENKDIKLVVLTSPTYEGIISDITEICNIAHKYNIPVLVDEAHGAHLNFMKGERELEALNCGADVVIQSLHKTLPSLTQTAILHAKGDLVSLDELGKQLSIFETSSPSYLFMVSIEECIDFINDNEKRFVDYESWIRDIYDACKDLKHIKLYGNLLDSNIRYDFGKIVIVTKDTILSGKDLSDILRNDYKIEVEMSYINYVICMTSVCDSKKNLKQLVKAIIDIDNRLDEGKFDVLKNDSEEDISSFDSELFENNILYKEAVDKISNEYMWVYPPGIPLITPGESVTDNLINKINKIRRANLEIRTSNNNFPFIEIKKK